MTTVVDRPAAPPCTRAAAGAGPGIGLGGSGGSTPPGTHPLADCLATVRSALARTAEVRSWSLADGDLLAVLSEASAARAQLDELTVRLVADADRRQTGPASGAASTTALLTGTQRVSRRAAGADLWLGRRLDTGRHEQTRTALAAGRVNAEQARVIIDAVDQLPDDVSAGQRVVAQTHLLDLAATHGPEVLRILGRRLLEVIDPDGADAHEGRLLEAEERAARAAARLRMRPDGHGSTRGTFRIPDTQAAMLQAALDALISPRRPTNPSGQTGPVDQTVADTGAADPSGGADRGPVDPDLDTGRLPYDQRMGHAFCELIEHLPLDAFPHAGRSTPVVTVTLDYDDLVDRVGAATMSTGGRTGAAQARRLACNAGIVPIVLGGESVVLDLGRASRYFSWHQRLALATEQRGCIADGCDRPPAWCEAHHLHPWADGGRTDLADGVLLCGFHHHLVHDTGWQVHRARDGTPEMVPPATIDPTRRPIRHGRFRRRPPD